MIDNSLSNNSDKTGYSSMRTQKSRKRFTTKKNAGYGDRHMIALHASPRDDYQIKWPTLPPAALPGANLLKRLPNIY